MKRLALVTAPGAESSASIERLAELLPHFELSFELSIFGPEGGGSVTELGGREAEPVSALLPRAFDQVLYFLEDDPAHAFMLPSIRLVGGSVVLHAWELGRLMRAARPALAEGGLAGQVAALREGGWSALWTYRRRGADAVLADLALNRSVVRHADGFIVSDADWRARILAERNAPTPVAVIPWGEGAAEESERARARRFVEAVSLLPTHRTNRKSLIRTAIEQADEARAEDAGDR